MKKITIGFSKSTKKFPIGSLAIRLFQRTEYSHVYLKFYSKTLNRVLIYEAVGSGIRFIGSKVWKEHAIEVTSFDIEINEDNYIRLMQFCVDEAGKDYGFFQNIGIFICTILKIKKNPFNSGKNCSEIIAQILKLEGYTFEGDCNLITPKQIYNILNKNNN